MSSTFIALPLTNGDAFLLRTKDKSGKSWNILVDSGKKYGKNTRELALILSQVSPKVEHVDIAICTHQDADHANGFWYFAEDWYDMGRTIGEYWLPGRWANAMPAILTDPSEFSARLMDGAEEASLQSMQGDFLERSTSFRDSSDILMPEEKLQLFALHNEVFSEEKSNVRVNSNEEENGSELGLARSFGLSEEELSRFKEDIEETDDTLDPLAVTLDISNYQLPRLAYYFERVEKRAEFFQVEAESRKFFAEAMDTAKAIRKISISAINHNIRVRWFDFGKFKSSEMPSGGNPGLLEPLCSVEVEPVPHSMQKMSNIALFVSLRLSRQNVESLVFYRPEDQDSPGVLFLGDSRLAYGVNRPEENFPLNHDRPKRKIIVTAPHHGSDKNDRAYKVLEEWLDDNEPIFIRNGGQSNQKLNAYLQYENRRCAQCVQCHGKTWNQWVAVNAYAGDWQWPPKADACGIPRI